MTKRLVCLLLALLTLLGCGLFAGAEEAGIPADAPSSLNQFEIYANGQNVPDACSILESGTTYVSAYHVARALCANVSIAWENGDTVVSGEGFTLTLRTDRPYLICNGRYLYAPDQVRVHPQTGDVLLPARVLALALGAQLSWDEAGVYLTSGTPLESGDAFYDAQDLDLIARVIQHESGNQPLSGKIGVANVILNRVKSPQFPGTVSGVLSQKNQFPGATNATPKAQAVVAAKLALDGANTVGGACWFNGAGKSCWASKNKSLITVIGGHAFYG